MDKGPAPISGRLSETLVSIGNLVNADQTKLTTMVSLDPMYVYFNVDEATVERIQQLIREGKLKSALPEEFASPSNAPPQAADSSRSGTDPVSVAVRQLREHAGQMRQVYLGLGNEKGNPHVAYVDFFNNQIALSTATLQVRAIFWNPMPKIGPRLFTPGMFVRVRVPTSPTYKALLVSQGAVVTNQNLKFVDIVNDQDEVVQRPVKLGGIQDGLQVIASGLKPGDHVIVDGLQHVHTGSKVKPKLVPMPLPTPQEQPPTRLAAPVDAAVVGRFAAGTSKQAGADVRPRRHAAREKVRSRARARPILYRPAHLRLGALPGDHPDRREWRLYCSPSTCIPISRLRRCR